LQQLVRRHALEVGQRIGREALGHLRVGARHEVLVAIVDRQAVAVAPAGALAAGAVAVAAVVAAGGVLPLLVVAALLGVAGIVPAALATVAVVPVIAVAAAPLV